MKAEKLVNGIFVWPIIRKIVPESLIRLPVGYRPGWLEEFCGLFWPEPPVSSTSAEPWSEGKAKPEGMFNPNGDDVETGIIKLFIKVLSMVAWLGDGVGVGVGVGLGEGEGVVVVVDVLEAGTWPFTKITAFIALPPWLTGVL